LQKCYRLNLYQIKLALIIFGKLNYTRKQFLLKLECLVFKFKVHDKIAQADGSSICYQSHYSIEGMLIGSCCIRRQWACCSTFKYLVSVCCSGLRWLLRYPSPLPASPVYCGSAIGNILCTAAVWLAFSQQCACIDCRKSIS